MKASTERKYAEPIVCSIIEAMRKTGFGKTKIYKLLSVEKLRNLEFSCRRLVIAKSFLELVEPST
jgi:hypothetical protein